MRRHKKLGHFNHNIQLLKKSVFFQQKIYEKEYTENQNQYFALLSTLVHPKMSVNRTHVQQK